MANMPKVRQADDLLIAFGDVLFQQRYLVIGSVKFIRSDLAFVGQVFQASNLVVAFGHRFGQCSHLLLR